MNWEAVRAEFPALQRFTYLNTATYGHVPLRSQAAVTNHFKRREEHGCTDFLAWFDDADEIRGLIGQLINCSGSDIAFISTAAAALSLFLGGIDWQAGDIIVTLRNEFPNQYYYANWLGARGVTLIEMDQITSIPVRTRAIVLSTVNYTTGYRPDLARISKLAHAANALLYIDGTQSLGALRFDVQAVQPDMFASDPYKWLLAPNGASFFYVSPALRKTLAPNVFGWRSDKGWRGVDDLHHGMPQLPENADRYEGGMLNFPSLYGLGESLRMNLELGPDLIEERVLGLSSLMTEILKQTGATVKYVQTNILGADWPDRDVTAIANTLQGQGIVVAARNGSLRISPHFYNNEADLLKVERALSALG